MHWTDLATTANLARNLLQNAIAAGDVRVSHENQDHRIDALILDLVEWVAKQPRPYSEVMEAWRTSCPKLAVWEEAVDRGLLVSQLVSEGGVLVTATCSGRRLLETRRAHAALNAR
jgi:hypothetical protein